MALMNTICSAQNAYYLANGVYSSSWEELDVSFGMLRSNDSTYVNISDNTYCYIGGTNNEYGGCAYSASSNCRALYLAWWSMNQRLCYASAGCERANKICKSVTGKTSFNTVGNENVYAF